MTPGLLRERILTCISLNNEAVLLLSAGGNEDRKALGLLKTGVEIVRDALFSSCPPPVAAPFVISTGGSSRGPEERGGGHCTPGRDLLPLDTGTTLQATLAHQSPPVLVVPPPQNHANTTAILDACEEEEHEHDALISQTLIQDPPIQLPGMTGASPAPRDQVCSFIFNRLFLMSPHVLASADKCLLHNKKKYGEYNNDHHEDLFVDPELQAVIAATLLFTMAMTYHRLACHANDANHANNKKARDAHTSKAIELYSTVLRLAQLDDSSCPCSGLSCDATIGILCCAALNNRSLLMFERGEYVSATEGFDLLHRLMFSSRRRFQEGMMLQLEELDGLILNILFLRQPPLAAAA